MNTTEYFTYINAMFLFCIFTCGLLVWAVIRGYILKGKLTKEQDAHLKATLINTKLNKALEDEKKISDTVEKLLRQVEAEVRELQYQLANVQKTADHYIDLSEQLHQKLSASKRVRNAKGVFVRKDGTYTPKVKPLPTIADEVVEYKRHSSCSEIAVDIETCGNLPFAERKPKRSHTLRRGMTVKNPTEKEAKEIFEAARVAGVEVNSVKLIGKKSPHIWFTETEDYNPQVSWRVAVLEHSQDAEHVVTASEFIARIKGEVG